MARKGIKKPLGRRTIAEAERLTRQQTTSRAYFWATGWMYGFYRFLPYWLIRLLPFIREDLIEQFRKEEAEAEEGEAPAIAESPERLLQRPYLQPGVPTLYLEKYPCVEGNPLSCAVPWQAIATNPEVKYCPKCQFPTVLAEKSEILGKRGRYRILGFLGNRGWGRLYEGVQLAGNRPVTIKEYLLPKRYFNEQEEREYKESFENVGGFALADGRFQDVRAIAPWEAIADRKEERCYIVSQGARDRHPSLGAYLHENGAMTPRQTLHLLDLVLQSLESLHGQKFRLPAGRIQTGVVHGNLTLDSLLVDLSAERPFFPDPQFWVYLTDFALWERRIQPPPIREQRLTPQRDLIALGYISFYALHGGWKLEGERWRDPRSDRHWSEEVPQELKTYILRLLEFNEPFPSAAAARQALPVLPVVPRSLEDELLTEEEESRRRRRFWGWWLLLLLLALGLGGTLGWWLLRRQAAVSVAQPPDPCCIREVPAVPNGSFTYTASKTSIWDYVVAQENLVKRGVTLADILAEQLPNLKLTYQPIASTEAAIANIRQGSAEFAVTTLPNRWGNDLEAETIAYDGLVVFVPFSYDLRQNSLPHALEGKISYEQLRQLYTGQITNWQELGGPDLPVKLYVPNNREAIRLFEQRVLQEETAIAQFRALWKSEARSNFDSFASISPNTEILSLRTFEIMTALQREFEEEQVGGIAFGSLSKVFGQCSVYPLAIATDTQPPIQPLIDRNGESITPKTDLCNAKGNYQPHVELLRNGRYPLAYPITIVYPLDNSRPNIGQKFAEILKTEESQNLLSKTGIVPLKEFADEDRIQR